MSRAFRVTGIMLHANATPCAYHCRYCQLKSSRPRPGALARYVALVERFIDWRAARRPDFELWPWYGNSHEHEPATLAQLGRLEARLGRRHDVVLLGGIAHRPRAAMEGWLRERQAAGIDTLVATFSGAGAVHDYWNNQPGNYRFQLEALALGAALGMRLQQRILLMRDSLPTLPQLCADLDALAVPEAERWGIPLFYSGRARRLQAQRLSVEAFATVPAQLLREDYPRWRSEQDWRLQALAEEDEQVEDITLALPIDDASLDWAEGLDCEEIVMHLEARYRAAAALLPTRRALAAACGDADSRLVYLNLGQVESLWMERYVGQHPELSEAAAQWLA